MHEIDQQYYQKEKDDIIRSRPGDFIQFDRLRLSELTQQVFLSKRTSPLRSQALREIEKIAQDLLQGESPIYSFRLVSEANPKTPLIDLRVDKFKTHNTWSNSLFDRSYSKTNDVLILHPNRRVQQPLGRYIFEHTTPLHSAAIEALTIQWRWWCVVVAVAGLSVYAGFLRWALLPVRKVIACLEPGILGIPRMIPKPRTLLERAYNNLARDAALTKLASCLREHIAQKPRLARHDLLEVLVREIHNHFGIWVSFWTFAFSNEGGKEKRKWVLKETQDRTGYREPSFEFSKSPLAAYFTKELSEKSLRDSVESWKGRLGEHSDTRGNRFFCFSALVYCSSSFETACLMVVDPPRVRGAFSAWERETYTFLAIQSRVAFEHLLLQRRILLQEKSKANVSLSRNLGHDLTNIIATGKLDLLTIGRFLELPTEQWVSSSKKEQIFRHSLRALVNNTKFMQEIINIYRSFSYLSRPNFERVDVWELASEVVELFRLSLSLSVLVESHKEGEVPSGLMEPRLIKLALFNILANSVDAIKLAMSGASHEEKWIGVSVGYSPETQEIFLKVSDTGTGILNPEGKPASSEEMERIFQVGYTTKETDNSEGLGLNWVYTIVNDFHGGRVEPRNRPEGGAEISVYLPVNGPSERSISTQEVDSLPDTLSLGVPHHEV